MAGDDDSRVLEWEIGLPTDDDLTPLSQSLVPPNLAAAFRISPEPIKTPLDVHRASHQTLASLRRSPNPAPSALEPFRPFSDDQPVIPAEDEPSSKARRIDSDDADTSSPRPDASSKRPRLVWTPQLHKRFVDVVAHLGIKNAVPKTIMQLMNVEGLTRDNVASHLQKYRLYLKRIQGLSNEGPSSSDQLFASTPVPQSLREPPPPVPVPVKYAMPTMIPMPMYGLPHHHHHHHHPAGMFPVNNHQGHPAYHGFESHHPYGAFGERPRDWPSGNNFGSMVSYPPRVTPNER